MRFFRTLALMLLAIPAVLSADTEKITMSSTIHATGPGFHRGYNSGQSMSRTFGSFIGVESYLAKVGDGRVLLGGTGLTWVIETGGTNNGNNGALAVLLTPVAIRVFDNVYLSAGYTHVLADKVRVKPTAKAVHGQLSFCAIGCGK